MSMFDELRCDYPLPDGFDPQGQWFQTTDTPEQSLARYILRSNGALVLEETGALCPFHGALTFYLSNISGSSLRGLMTRDGTAPWEAEYCALYDHGQLVKLEGQRRAVTDRPWLTREAFYARESTERRGSINVGHYLPCGHPIQHSNGDGGCRLCDRIPLETVKYKAELDALRSAVMALSTDMHEVSDRPCDTCHALTVLLKSPFGCYQLRARLTSRKT